MYQSPVCRDRGQGAQVFSESAGCRLRLTMACPWGLMMILAVSGTMPRGVAAASPDLIADSTEATATDVVSDRRPAPKKERPPYNMKHQTTEEAAPAPTRKGHTEKKRRPGPDHQRSAPRQPAKPPMVPPEKKQMSEAHKPDVSPVPPPNRQWGNPVPPPFPPPSSPSFGPPGAAHGGGPAWRPPVPAHPPVPDHDGGSYHSGHHAVGDGFLDAWKRVTESPVFEKMMELMRQNVELRAQLEIAKLENQAAEKIHSLQLEHLQQQVEQLHREQEGAERLRNQVAEMMEQRHALERELHEMRSRLEQQSDILEQRTRQLHEAEARIAEVEQLARQRAREEIERMKQVWQRERSESLQKP
ncbi:MAG: hypothetical protein KatS3mg111_3862 [Pirellulaceae bacterium]|nr:MAG: hypothetical protein KatS3mg111_3862 [Pirellulaceae bacterium]